MSAFAIGIENVKNGVNLGTLMRSAYNLGASAIFTVGRKYRCNKMASDTVKAFRLIPYTHYDCWDDYRKHAIYGWVPIGVELTPDAKDIRDFSHPKNAVYILGAEDSGISNRCLNEICQGRVIKIPSKQCLNVAVAGSIVMYDRMLNEPRKLEMAS